MELNKRHLEWMKTVGPFVLLAVTVFTWYWPLWKYGFTGDDFHLLSANQSQGANRWQYWWSLFLRRNGFEVQYRPIGFFSYFYIARSLFGLAVWKFRLLGLGLLISTSWVLLIWFRRLLNHIGAATLGALFFALHPTHVYVLGEISCYAKYYLPLLLFCISLLWIESERGSRMSWPMVVGLTFGVAFSIMCNEGCFVFPLVYLAYGFIRKKPWTRMWVCMIPSLIYLGVRLFVWKLPQHGFMTFQWLAIPRLFFYYQNFLWNYPLGFPIVRNTEINFIPGFIVVSALIAVTVLIGRRTHQWLPLFAILAATILVVPFAGLARHLEIGKYLCWASVGFALFLAWCACEALQRRAHAAVSAMGGAVVMAIFLLQSHLWFAHIEGHFQRRQSMQNAFVEDMKSQLQSAPAASEILLTYPPIDMTPYWAEYLNQFLIPGLLAAEFPHLTFVIPFTPDGQKFIAGGLAMVIKNGGVYRVLQRDDGVQYRIDSYGNWTPSTGAFLSTSQSLALTKKPWNLPYFDLINFN